MKEALLQVEGLTTSFYTEHGLIAAAEKISFDVGEKEIVAVVGESGSGKTVTCLSLMGLTGGAKTARVEGSARFLSKELVGADERALREMRGRDISMVFQEPMSSLNPVFRIGEQIDETLAAHTRMSRQERKARIIELLHLVGIPEPEKRAKCYPFELSGGMKQRAMIAMALSCNPKLLIADEPTTALDVTIQAQILTLLKDLRESLGMSILLISHDLGVVANFAERVVVMYAGQVVEQGQTDDVIHRPLHPYTRGLIDSIPRLGAARHSELNVIPGGIPGLNDMPAGCRFFPRCPDAKARCANEPAAMVDLGAGRLARCHRLGEKEDA